MGVDITLLFTVALVDIWASISLAVVFKNSGSSCMLVFSGKLSSGTFPCVYRKIHCINFDQAQHYLTKTVTNSSLFHYNSWLLSLAGTRFVSLFLLISNYN